MTLAEAPWTPNQQAARRRIVEAAADLIGREGLRACTLRAVAAEAGLKKSTIHYYVDDANELLDLSVIELFNRLARQASDAIAEMPDGPAALELLVRLFMGRGWSPPFRDGTLVLEYTAHAWRRGAHEQIHRRLEVMRTVFELALRKAGVGEVDAARRSASVHDHLLGAMVRNMVRPIDRAEIAEVVSSLCGVALDAERC